MLSRLRLITDYGPRNLSTRECISVRVVAAKKANFEKSPKVVNYSGKKCTAIGTNLIEGHRRNGNWLLVKAPTNFKFIAVARNG